MKRVWLLGLLMLGACAPSTSTSGPQFSPEDTAALELGKGDAASLSRGFSGRGEPALRFSAVGQDVTLGQWKLSGSRLRLNDARCVVNGPEVLCDFSRVLVPAGKSFVLEMTGEHVDVFARYRLPDGALRAKFLTPPAPDFR
ncbi:hypothetical protein [Deinococcus peraridilitoris]|uniref:Lipoprotein n=1 Tax=Deinococcus peraridilitoris (strain DSM 19664 / LMG 22246 / CIP 109416 / KR-200) TaxID=937777 RepID=K9ZYQ3_DEIPD|nr:hypothetical protein [Deinococcus peraridilitoris]AFZ66052.1 hypothetical protein Deipe_0456 [Deinococcus peraridilitoris DSM 19664]